MNQEENEIFLLKKRLENRESTISFLNEIIDAQSKSIEEIKKRVGLSNDKLLLSYEDEVAMNDFLTSEISRLEDKYKSKVKEVEELKKENELLKSKLNVLFNAFDSVKETKKETVQDTDSIWKQRHDEELKSPMWKKKREEVFERYGKQCVECGNTNNLQVHHLVYRKNRHLWEYNVDEMIPLCKKCHEKVHKDKKHKFHEKYIN